MWKRARADLDKEGKGKKKLGATQDLQLLT